MQFYATSCINWRPIISKIIEFFKSNFFLLDLQQQQPLNQSTHKFSYKPKQLYWYDYHDVQSEVTELCRKLKKDPNPKSYYEVG